MHLPHATQRRVLQKWIIENSDSEDDPNKLAPKAKQLLEMLQKKDFSVLQISDRYFVHQREGYLCLETKNPILSIPQLAIVEDCPLFLANGYKILIQRGKIGGESNRSNIEKEDKSRTGVISFDC